MKISEVTLTLFSWEGVPPTQYAPGLSNLTGRSELGLLRIATDEGVAGHSLLGSTMRPASLDAKALVDWLKPMLMGRDPLERERLNRQMRQFSRSFTQRAQGAVDVALWDIAGRLAGMPIHRLIGSCRSSIPAYASSQRLPTPEAYAEQAMYYKSLGWRAYKIHPAGRADADLRICETVRREVGDDYLLMLDASFAYRYEDALRVGRAIEKLGFYWYEDPLSENDLYNYVKLKQKLDIPIMATELPPAGFDSYAIWITERATDFLRGDVAMKGGITPMLKTAHLAEAFGMQYEIHHGGNSANNFAGLHVAMAIPNCEFFEVTLPERAHRYGLVRDIEVDSNGLVHAPEGPGLGAEIDFELVRSKQIAVLA